MKRGKKDGTKLIPPSRKGVKLSEIQRLKLKKAQAFRIGVPRTAEVKNKISLKHKGKILSAEHRRKLSEAKFKNPIRYWKDKKLHPNTLRASLGKNHWAWRGGVTSENMKIRNSLEMRLWRKSVYIRDGFKCIWCSSNKKLQADHIKPFALYPELRFAIDNGRTLCLECHKKTDTYGVKSKK